jgi:hypothetical protein
MFKSKFINLLMLAFAIISFSQNALGENNLPVYCDSRLQVKVKTGMGKVYAANYKETSPSANDCIYTEYTAELAGTRNGSYRPCPFKILAVPAEGYEFDYWECKQNIGDYDTNSATAEGTILHVSDSENEAGSIWNVNAAYSKRKNATESNVGNPSNVINAIWEVHFKEIVNQCVKVESENASLGSASINKGNNFINDEVTLTANCNSEHIMFKGWYRLNPSTGQKEFVTKNNPYIFTIDADNQGTYYAQFEDGYNFWRVKNDKTGHYLMAKTEFEGSVTLLTLADALNTQMGFDNTLNAAITDEGSMMKIFLKGNQQATNTEIWDIYVQNDNTSKYYNTTPGDGVCFIIVKHSADNSYFFQDNGQKNYLTEFFSSTRQELRLTSGLPSDKSGNWQFEGMDKDLTTKENYFAVAPEEFVGPDADGYYWTTLRVCFNMLYETSEMTPYIVTAADASTGEMTLTEVTGGIIPEKKCVLLKCKSTDVTRNVMIPTTSTSSFDMSDNLLISSTYYYKNQTVSGDAAFSGKTPKGIKLVDDMVGFGGNTLITVDGNRAYLNVANDVAVASDAESITLAQMLEIGNTDKKYRVTDLTCVDAIGNVLYCKDDDGYPENGKSIIQEGELDYVKDYAHLLAREDWDQSNWVAVTVPGDPTTDLLGSRLNNVIGHLTNTVNPEFVAEKMPEAGEPNPYTENTYITCNFVSEHQAGIMLNGQSRNCFFVAPKPMEIAKVEWAMWDADREKFVKPSKDASALQGEFFANFTMLPLPLQPELTDGGGYHFKALIKNENVNSSTLKGEPTRAQSWVAYPLEWSEEGTVTDVDELSVSKVVSRIVYYNMMGQASMVPHCGLNVVVTEYSDGSRSAMKMIK